VLLHLHPYLSNVETLIDDIDTALGIKPLALDAAAIKEPA
jgi:hypothetical protein